MNECSADRPSNVGPRVTFVLEQTLGHVTHSQNLQSLLANHPSMRPTFLEVPYDVSGFARLIPGYRNWTVRSGLRTRRAIRKQWRTTGIDVLFIHTFVPAIFAGRWMKRIPTVISLDATPKQYDELGLHYGHERSTHHAERLKKIVSMRCFRRARHIISWSKWTRESLIDDYGVERELVSVIPPGVEIEQWQRRETDPDTTPLRILFVGGDLRRKGAPTLIAAVRQLRQMSDVPEFEVHIVSGSAVPIEPGFVVHADLTPNSSGLIELYHSSQIFCLPTFGDCLPMVLSEAGVAGLALVTTRVGAIDEIVDDERSGLLVEAGDVDALVLALRRLLTEPDLRKRLGSAAETTVRDHLDARSNAEQIAEILLDVSAGRPPGRALNELNSTPEAPIR